MEQNQNYGKRMWSILGPLLIKIAVALAVEFAVVAVLVGRYMLELGASGDMDALLSVTSDMKQYEAMLMTVMNWLLDITVPVEGAAALCTIPILLFLMHRDKKKERQQFPAMKEQKAPFWKYAGIVVMAAALCMALNNLMLVGNLSSYSASYEETMEALYRPSFGMQIVCLGFIIPVCEELVFRGLIYRRVRVQMQAGFLRAAVCSSLMFAILHGNLVQMIYGFAMGLMFAYVYEKYGSVLAPVTAHIAANLVSVIGTQYGWFDWMMQDVMYIGTVTVVCAALASTMYVLMKRMESSLTI